jgi:thioredoxin-related protein
MQKVKLILLSAWVLVFSCAQKPVPGHESLKWLQLDEAVNNRKILNKPLLIDLYTDWCGWCKVMDKKTYTNAKVIEYISEHFYPVKINAESKEAFHWNGTVYNFNTAYKSNDFAIYLTKGRLAFPTTVIIPSDGSEPQAIPGYLEPKDLELIVKYFGEGAYGKMPFQDFQKQFSASW